MRVCVYVWLIETASAEQDFIESEDGKGALYLAITKATQSPNSDLSMALIDDHNLSTRTFGVFTHCDFLQVRSRVKLSMKKNRVRH